MICVCCGSGALRGLETFSQLVLFDFDTGRYTLRFAPWTITDAPRFPHRGLMIDSARHFLPVQTIKKVINSLPYAKLNVLHWHMTDTQSFPLEVKSSPKLWDAAYSDQEKFTQLDIASVVEYARLRGVRVIVEFDMRTFVVLPYASKQPHLNEYSINEHDYVEF